MTTPEQNLELIWRLFGISAMGFFFLMGCFWFIIRQLPNAKTIAEDLRQIKDAMIGTMHKPGYITVLHNVKKEVEDIRSALSAKKEGA